MDLAKLSVQRPIFITCIVLLILALGYLSVGKLPVDMFPDVNFPIVQVNVPYPGAAPSEVETQVSKIIEEELGSLPGVKSVSSISQEGVSTIIAEFTLETDIKYAEQQIRDRVSSVKFRLPRDAKEPVIRRLDPADMPVISVAVSSDLPPAKLYDLTKESIKPRLEQVSQVGVVNISGGKKREIWVELDRNKLFAHELSASRVAQSISASGVNVPAGRVDGTAHQTVIRTLGEYGSLQDIGNVVVNFLGSDVPIRVQNLGVIKDTLEEEKSIAYVNGKKALLLQIYKQSGSNTIAVVKGVKKRLESLQKELNKSQKDLKLTVVVDGSKEIKANVDDVKESIFIGIVLTIIVVYFFLGNGRSTVITSLALPNSLLGAFFLMAIAGFSINVMTLLALSLSVGLLIDDAIVVRENIFRHLEMGKSAIDAAIEGTKEVRMAVVATTFTVIAVFGPIAFLQGIVGQFFKEFGLTICFALLISLFDALTIAPMLSAYFAGKQTKNTTSLWGRTIGKSVEQFDRFQNYLEDKYVSILEFSLKRPFLVISSALVIFIASIMVIKYVPKTFLPPQDFGEFIVALEMPEGTTLKQMDQVTQIADKMLKAHPEVLNRVVTVGTDDGASNKGQIYVTLVESKFRKVNTSEFKDLLRKELKSIAYAKPVVKDSDIVGGGERPFNLDIVGADLNQLRVVADQILPKLKKLSALQDIESSYKEGKPEFQIKINDQAAVIYGVSSVELGQELRAQVEGVLVGKYRENGLEYDIRTRLQEEQRNLQTQFSQVYVQNVNQKLIPVSRVASAVNTVGAANINRYNRGRYIRLAADISSDGNGIGGAMQDIDKMFKNEVKLPAGVTYAFRGQAESFQELGTNMMIAAVLGILFIFLVLASLYESFVTPLTIMLVLPLAICGAFISLFITQKSLDIFSMIGCIMLLGIATKNSILLVDYANQKVQEGHDFATAMILSGRTRLRPILMTTFALIAGMLPVAIGLNEASKQRTSMGVAIIGGLISSTLLTLVVVPAAYSYLERFRVWSNSLLKRWFIVS
jgi:HAE1 family hydrophobic/amphiphilic exporter-1